MDAEYGIGTGVPGLDGVVGGLRAGDCVAWQIDSIDDYRYVADRFVRTVARRGRRIVYLRFGSHAEVVDAAELAASGCSIKKYELDPRAGFETFAVQLHRTVSGEGPGVFFIFDCLSDLQKHWFSDHMVGNLFYLAAPMIRALGAVAYVPLMYERHTYETTSRVLQAASVLLNMRRTAEGLYILTVKAEDRRTPRMFFPLRIRGERAESVTGSMETYALFDKFTQTGEKRDCWDRMFDHLVSGSEEPEDEDGAPLRDNILRCLLGNEPRKLALCARYFTTRDLLAIKRREVGTGCIGGKAVGMLLARHILREEAPELFERRIVPHDSYFIGADVFYSYSVQNDCWSLRLRMVEPKDYLDVAPELGRRLRYGRFSRAIREQFVSVLEYFGQSPIIVRSSSLLEDGMGNAFAGKYESMFCPNQGTLEERYAAFEQAVRQVYASTMNEAAVRYRAERGLLGRDEQMALLVMRVSGDCRGPYYYPHVSGVGHSRNVYTFRPGKTENRGMLRLVFGLGTRAVDREADDYARLVDLGAPAAPPMVAYGDEYRYSQHKADVIDLAQNAFRTVPVPELRREDLGADPALFLEQDRAAAGRLREAGETRRRAPDVLSFPRLLRRTDFPDTMARLMRTLEEKYQSPVDVEFACNFRPDGGYGINLLQCRTLQSRGAEPGGAGGPPAGETIFRTRGSFMGGSVRLPVDAAVLVRTGAYLDLPEHLKYETARCVGRLNEALRGRNAVLIGPGRWGTTTPSLGVPVNFMEISGFRAIAEVADSARGLRPDLSYGCHFFQDMVEAGTFYAAVYPDEPDSVFDEAPLADTENRYRVLLGPEAADLAAVIRVCDLSARGAVLYADLDSGECRLVLTGGAAQKKKPEKP